MKIDLVIPSLDVGGSERQLVGLAVGLKAAGHDVGVIVLQSGGVLEHELVIGGVPIHHVGCSTGNRKSYWRLGHQLRLPSQMLKLCQYWRTRRPDAVQAWLPAAQVVALPVAAILSIPQRIMAVRSMSAPVRLTFVNRWLLRAAARCTTVISANAQAILGDRGWPIGGRPAQVISNAVSAPIRSSKPARQPPRGIVVANLTAIKGYDLLIDALSILEDPPSFTFVGSGIERDWLARRLTKARLQTKVRIIEGVTEPSDLLSEAQFFVLPSPSEGLPNAILEAMASGLPTIAFRVGGIPEIVIHGETGVLVAPGDVPGLARAIDQVARDPAWREVAGANAFSFARTFSWESLVMRNLELMGITTTIGLTNAEGDVL